MGYRTPIHFDSFPEDDVPVYRDEFEPSNGTIAGEEIRKEAQKRTDEQKSSSIKQAMEIIQKSPIKATSEKLRDIREAQPKVSLSEAESQSDRVKAAKKRWREKNREHYLQKNREYVKRSREKRK